jgi:hypothetical protein
MWRMAGTRILCCALAVILIGGSIGHAQTSMASPPAPVPVQIGSAKKVFISNASGEELDPRKFFLPSIDRDLAYAKFFTALQAGGRYEPVLNPSDADLVLEIRFMKKLVPEDELTDPCLRLLILDPRTHTLLWAFSARVELSAGFHAAEKREKNLDQAIAELVGNLVKLASQPTSSTAGPSK